MLDHPEFLGRLSRQYRPGMWIGGIRRAFGPMAELPEEGVDPGVVHQHPPHYLIALWAPLTPGQPMLPRWPVKAALCSPDARTAVAGLLTAVPPGDRLWISDPPFDWTLVADIVMLCETELAHWQYRALHEFVRQERQATLTAISVNYGGSDEVFDLFRRTGPGDLD